MRQPHTKGAHVINAVKVLRANRERALALLPPSLHKYLEQRILASTWYPLDEHLGLLNAIAQMWPPSAGDPWVMIGRGTAQMDLTGIYKLHLKPHDPARTLISMGALWRSAHDTGELSVTAGGTGEATLVLRDFSLRSRDYCRITTGYISEVLLLSGAHNGDVSHTRCRGGGAKECVWRATWT